MDKLEFNKLELQEQVQYINDQLQIGLSLTNICKAMGIDRSTVRKRFTSKGYRFNPDVNLYEGSILDMGIELKQAPTPNKKPPKIKTNTGNTNTLEDRVKALESQLKVLQSMIDTNAMNTNNTGINVTTFEGDTVTRAYRLDAQVQKEFKIFCKKNSEYKVQDLISSALQKFMDENK